LTLTVNILAVGEMSSYRVKDVDLGVYPSRWSRLFLSSTG
jgi:hypothetical protein